MGNIIDEWLEKYSNADIEKNVNERMDAVTMKLINCLDITVFTLEETKEEHLNVFITDEKGIHHKYTLLSTKKDDFLNKLTKNIKKNENMSNSNNNTPEQQFSNYLSTLFGLTTSTKEEQVKEAPKQEEKIEEKFVNGEQVLRIQFPTELFSDKKLKVYDATKQQNQDCPIEEYLKSFPFVFNTESSVNMSQIISDIFETEKVFTLEEKIENVCSSLPQSVIVCESYIKNTKKIITDLEEKIISCKENTKKIEKQLINDKAISYDIIKSNMNGYGKSFIVDGENISDRIEKLETIRFNCLSEIEEIEEEKLKQEINLLSYENMMDLEKRTFYKASFDEKNKIIYDNGISEENDEGYIDYNEGVFSIAWENDEEHTELDNSEFSNHILKSCK